MYDHSVATLVWPDVRPSLPPMTKYGHSWSPLAQVPPPNQLSDVMASAALPETRTRSVSARTYFHTAVPSSAGSSFFQELSISVPCGTSVGWWMWSVRSTNGTSDVFLMTQQQQATAPPKCFTRPPPPKSSTKMPVEIRDWFHFHDKVVYLRVLRCAFFLCADMQAGGRQHVEDGASDLLQIYLAVELRDVVVIVDNYHQEEGQNCDMWVRNNKRERRSQQSTYLLLLYKYHLCYGPNVFW